MVSAKQIYICPIDPSAAREFVKKHHYSGKVDTRSCLHLGVFLSDDTLHGVMQFGPPIDKRRALMAIPGCRWDQLIELARMAFDEHLPRNSESRAIGFALRELRKRYGIVWVQSYADATQCGDGAIYRASGFSLVSVKKNTSLWRLPSGEVICDIVTRMKSDSIRDRIGMSPGESMISFASRVGAERLPGYQLRYMKCLKKAAEDQLALEVLPYSRIVDLGASMRYGRRLKHRGCSDASSVAEGGSSPTQPLLWPDCDQ